LINVRIFVVEYGKKLNLCLHQRNNNDWRLLWTTGSQQY
jgi:hypothetical protein